MALLLQYTLIYASVLMLVYFCGFVLFFKHCMNRKAKK